MLTQLMGHLTVSEVPTSLPDKLSLTSGFEAVLMRKNWSTEHPLSLYPNQDSNGSSKVTLSVFHDTHGT